MSEDNKSTFDIQQVRSLGGKARANKLTAEQRKQIAVKANASKKCNSHIPKTTHTGEMYLGDIVVSCAVLNDGRRLITQSSMSSSLGRKSTSSSRICPEGALAFPIFMSSECLRPFITKEVEKLAQPLIFIHSKYGKAHGFDASLLPKVCNIYLEARRAGVLQKGQLHIADRCEVLIAAFAQIGLMALIDEATGYQQDRERDELQKMLAKFISQELLPWVRRFPNSFFDNYKKLYSIPKAASIPLHVGHFINTNIYKKLADGVLEELKKKNPITETGTRAHKHHQFLSQEIGCPALEKQILKVNTLMKVSKNKDHFDELLIELEK